MTELKKLTVRCARGGKAHQAIQHSDGFIAICCGCPNTRNGSARKRMQIICEGWDKANCGGAQR